MTLKLKVLILSYLNYFHFEAKLFMFEFCFCREEILSLFRTSLSPWRLRSQVQCIDLAYFQPYSPLLLQFSVVIHQKSFLICCRLLIRNLLFTWLNLPSRRCHVYSKTTRLPRTQYPFSKGQSTITEEVHLQVFCTVLFLNQLSDLKLKAFFLYFDI